MMVTALKTSRRQRGSQISEFKASLGYIGRPCLNKEKKKKV